MATFGNKTYTKLFEAHKPDYLQEALNKWFRQCADNISVEDVKYQTSYSAGDRNTVYSALVWYTTT